MAYKNVIVVGARGRIGDPLVRALLASTEPRFHVTALARSTSTMDVPTGPLDQPTQEPTLPSNQLDVIKVDFIRHLDLVRVFSGQDVAIITISSGKGLAATSKILIEAAIEAGVKRIIPSEFGSDESPVLAMFNEKAAVKTQLEKASKDGKVSYTIIRTGPWFDITFNLGLGFDIAAKTATIYNGGTDKFHATTMESILFAVLSVISNPAPYTNKVLHIHDFFTSQQEILAAVESVSGERFKVVDVNAEEVGEKCLEALKRGEFSGENMLGVIRMSVLGKESAARWDENDDSTALGLGGKRLEEEIQKLVELSGQAA